MDEEEKRERINIKRGRRRKFAQRPKEGWGWVRTEREDAGEDAERWNVGRKQRLTDGSIKIAAMLYYILLQRNI